MDELISKRQAIDALCHVDEYNGRSIEAIRQLPPAELSTNLAEVGTDTISRQAAIDLIESIETERLKGNIELIYAPAIKGLRALPSAQPEIKQQAINSSDCIDRQAAIDAMAELQGRASTKAELKGISKAWKRIKQLPPIQPEPHWIPVTKQMPPINEDVLVSGDGYVWKDALLPRDESNVLEWYHDGTFRDDYAWQPLPDPYNGD